MENLRILTSKNLYLNLEHFALKKVCAMVKADAYGHGLNKIVELLDGRVAYFGVVNIKEAMAVRKITDTPILLCCKLAEPQKCKRLNLDVIVEDEKDIFLCVKYGIKNIHLKIDCGMNRFGAKNEIELKMIDKILVDNGIKLKSIMTHFPKVSSRRVTMRCFEKFKRLRANISQNAAISFGGSGIDKYNFDFDIIRVGLGLYGYGQKSLKPILKIQSYVEKIVFCKRGEMLGYGYKVKHDGLFAIVPVGYGDGLRRKSKHKVKINNQVYLSEGNLCMDVMFIKVDSKVNVGDTVLLMNDANHFERRVSAYEVLTALSKMRAKTIIE